MTQQAELKSPFIITTGYYLFGLIMNVVAGNRWALNPDDTPAICQST